jgi:hypothetical protein
MTGPDAFTILAYSRMAAAERERAERHKRPRPEDDDLEAIVSRSSRFLDGALRALHALVTLPLAARRRPRQTETETVPA